jgi:electron transfer flavoprotein beta subunit
MMAWEENAIKIVVCVKQVIRNPMDASETKENTLKRDSAILSNNPNDLGAVETGLRLKENYHGTLIVLSMGPPKCIANIREVLSLGADKAILLASPRFAGADTLATSYTLAAAIQKIGAVDLVITGQQSVDGETGQTGPGLAEHLNLPHLSNVGAILETDESTGVIIVEKITDQGFLRLRSPLPVVVSISKKLIDHRRPKLKGKLAANRADVAIWTEADLKLDCDKIGLNGSPTRVINLCNCEQKHDLQIFDFHTNQESVYRLFENVLASKTK